MRVLDIGTLIVGPFGATMLGYFGTEIIKVEQPGIGDALRGTPGRIAHAGPPLGKHNEEIHGGLLAKTEAEMRALAEAGVI